MLIAFRMKKKKVQIIEKHKWYVEDSTCNGSVPDQFRLWGQHRDPAPRARLPDRSGSIDGRGVDYKVAGGFGSGVQPFNGLAQFTAGRNSKVAVRARINNKMSDQVTVKTSSSERLSLALASVLPSVISAYKKFWSSYGEKNSAY